jgi:hypothetical protein
MDEYLLIDNSYALTKVKRYAKAALIGAIAAIIVFTLFVI